MVNTETAFISAESDSVNVEENSKEDLKSIQKMPKVSELASLGVKLDQEILMSLKQAYSIGATDEEAASYAGIHRATLYRHLKESPEFKDWCENLKRRPILKAKSTVVANLNDPIIAFRYLERKARVEFAKDAPPDADIKDETVVIYVPEKKQKRHTKTGENE